MLAAQTSPAHDVVPPECPPSVSTKKHTNPHLVSATSPPAGTLCRRCGSRRLERRHRTNPLHWILSHFSVYPFLCVLCFRCQLRFVPPGRPIRPHLTMRRPAEASVNSGTTRAHVTSADLTRFERMMLARKQQTLRNDDVIRLLSWGVEPPLVVKMIDSSSGFFDLTRRGVLQLKYANVGVTVIEAMIDRSLLSESGSQ